MDERDWTDSGLQPGDRLSLGAAELVACAPPTAAYLVSGALAQAIDQICPGAPCLGLLDTLPDEEGFAIRMGRSSALVVLPSPAGIDMGWNAAGFGISAATGGHLPFDILGSGANDVLGQGGVDPDSDPSPSAAILFAGVSVLLLRRSNGFRLYVPRAYATYMSDFLSGARPSGLVDHR